MAVGTGSPRRLFYSCFLSLWSWAGLAPCKDLIVKMPNWLRRVLKIDAGVIFF